MESWLSGCPKNRLCRRSSYLKNLQHFIAVVSDDLDGDFAGGGFWEGATGGGVEGEPGGFVDVGPESLFQLGSGLVGPGDVGVAYKETLAVVVGVKEPGGQVSPASRGFSIRN